MQGSGQEPSTLPNSTVPLKVVRGDDFAQVIASWGTTYGIIGNDTLQLDTGVSGAPPSFSNVSGGSFAAGAVVGIVAAGGPGYSRPAGQLCAVL